MIVSAGLSIDNMETVNREHQDEGQMSGTKFLKYRSMCIARIDLCLGNVWLVTVHFQV